MAIIAVWGPPQSGKTTLAVDLAYALSRLGRAVCLISPEPYSELTAHMNLRITRQKSLAQALEAPGNLRQTVCEADELFYVLAQPWDTDAFEEEPDDAEVIELLKQAKDIFDDVLVDCPSDSGNMIAARAISRAKKVILLSGGSTAAALWYNAYRRSVDTLEGRSFCVCDQVTRDFDYAALCKLLRFEAEIFTGHCPEASAMHEAKNTLYGTSSKHGKKYTAALDTIIDKLEVKKA